VIKNLIPRQIALLFALLLGIFFLLALLVCGATSLFMTVATICFVVFAFLLSLYSIEYFIYRRIKLIYKSIHKLKKTSLNKDQLNVWSNADPLDKVNEDVKNWASDQGEIIALLKNQEAFRKEFLANVSHELKTPIFSIQGYIHTLLDGALDDASVNRRFLEKAAKNADRLQMLVEELLAINKLENGDFNIELGKFDIWTLSKEVWEQLEVISSQKNIKLRFKEGCNKPFFVIADKEGIRQVLTNLFSNSIKYGAEEGETNVSFYNMDDTLMIEITDGGEGIAQKDIPRLFERFYRVEKSRSRDMGGTGLGLSIVKHILEAHDQTINVRSTIGEGSTFAFTLKSS